MVYPLHQPISITTGEKIATECRRDGVFVDVARDRADVLIVDERASYDTATQVATDTEVAEPWPFDAAQTKWKLKRTTRAKTAGELAADLDNQSRVAILNGLLDLAQITLTLIDKLIAKGTIVANDFDADTRALYQSLKSHVDRLR